MTWWQRLKALIATRDPLDVDDRMQGTMPIPKNFRSISEETHKRMLDEVRDPKPKTKPWERRS